MKIKHYLSALFLLLSIYGYSQSGIECVECGGMNGNHKTTCSSYNQSSSGISSSNKTSFERDIMLNIFSTALNNLLSTKPSASQPSDQDIEKARQQETQKRQALAVLLAKQKQYNDSVAGAKHKRMMKDYKQLEGGGAVKFKTLTDDTWEPSVHFNCKITAIRGDVTVLKSNGESIRLSETQSVDLVPGDWIATGKNSRLKMHYAFENGGEDLLLGQETVINILTNEDGAHVPKLLKGDIYVVNSKLKEELADRELDKKDELANESPIMQKLRKKLGEVRTPNAICGVRGTEFTVHVDEVDNTEVNVKGGIVDLTGNLMNGTITLTAGTKGIVKGTGEIKGPLKMDEKKFKTGDQTW